MGRRPSRRRLTRPVAGLAAFLLVAAGCARIEPPTGDPDAGAVLSERLNAATRDRNPVAFLANFAGTAAIGLGQRWYRMAVTTGATVAVPPGGSLLEVTWTVPGDRGEARTTLYTILGSRDGEPVITGVRDADNPAFWTLDFVDVTPAQRGTLLSSGLPGETREDYAAQLDRAVAAVADAGVVSRRAGWKGQVVVERPAEVSDFVAMSGWDADDAAGVADCGVGTARIEMNPRLDDRWFEITLVHETVHAATDSPCFEGEQWAVEGLADWVTERAYPEVAVDNRELVRTYLRQHGVPDGLPAEVEDSTDYALAAIAVDQVFAHLPRAKAVDLLDRFIRDGAFDEADEARARGWYRAELRRIRTSG